MQNEMIAAEEHALGELPRRCLLDSLIQKESDGAPSSRQCAGRAAQLPFKAH
jgi:hypothetical protein